MTVELKREQLLYIKLYKNLLLKSSVCLVRFQPAVLSRSTVRTEAIGGRTSVKKHINVIGVGPR